MQHSIIRSLLAAAVAAAATFQSASAATVQLQQFWDAAAQPNVQGELATRARWDDSTITGVGAEQVFLDIYTVTRTLNGVGQSFEYALLPDPADVFTQQLNTLVALYNDGVFQAVAVVSHGGNGFVSLSFDQMTATGTGVGFRQFGGQFQFIYPLPVSGVWYYNLDNARTVLSTSTPLPTPVPIPGAALLFLCGAGMIGALRRLRGGAS